MLMKQNPLIQLDSQLDPLMKLDQLLKLSSISLHLLSTYRH